MEKAKIPLIAKDKTGRVFACEVPENLVCRSNSTPVDLNPTQEKKPL